VNRASSIRWSPWLTLLLQAVPTAEGILASDIGRALAAEDGDPMPDADTPGQIHTSLIMQVLSEDQPAPGTEDFWPAFLAFTELNAEAYTWLSERTVDRDDDEDLLELMTFVEAGVVCDITRSRNGFEQLLPFLGPNLVAVAHAEIGHHHRVRNNWGGRDLDWRPGGSQFRPLDYRPWELLPPDRREDQPHGSGM
jgi:hypothetical protein